MQVGHSTRGRAAVWTLVALAAATRLTVALADYRSLIANDVYADDAFYYLRIAANLVAGRGLTFDGAAPTNGFHPLYLLMVVPIMALSKGNLVMPIHLTAVLLTGWAVGTAVILHALLSKLGGRIVALFGLLIWAICPYFVLMSINGLETGLSIFFAVLLPYLYLSWFRGERPPSARQALAFGGVSGLAILARVDLALLLAAIAVDWLVSQRTRLRQTATAAGLTLAAAAAVWLPWGLVSRSATGYWLPLSGSASRLIALNLGWHVLQQIWVLSPHGLVFDPQHVPASFYMDVVTKLGFVFVFENPLLAPLRANVAGSPWANLDFYLPYQLFRRNPQVGTVVTVIVVVAIAAVARRLSRARSTPASAPLRASLRRIVAAYLLLVGLGYSFYSPAHWYFNRYLVGAIVLTTVWLLVDVAAVCAGLRRGRTALAAVATVIVICQATEWRFVAGIRWSHAPPAGLLASWEALGRRVDRTERLGAFQAGIYGYFSGRDVINLDGKVNQDAFAALRDKRLHEYIQQQGVRYVLDYDWVLEALCARYAEGSGMSFRPVADTGGVTHLYEVVRN